MPSKPSKSGSENPKYLISASRREDMLAWRPEKLNNILSGNTTGPFRHIRPEKIHTLVLWTKDYTNIFQPPLFDTIKSISQTIMHLTVTGLGNTVLEPGVPDYTQILKNLKGLINILGSPKRLFWRYDPLIKLEHFHEHYQFDDMNFKNKKKFKKNKKLLTNLNEKLFSNIARIMADHGVEKCITSIVTPYKKVLNRLQKLDFEMNSRPLENKTDFIDTEFQQFIEFMYFCCRDKGLTLQTCCTPGIRIKHTSALPENRPGHEVSFEQEISAPCIDRSEIQALHDLNIPLANTKKPAQRAGCLCSSSWDIGWYQNCPHNCLYCYARP
jgi:hypothetical protein